MEDMLSTIVSVLLKEKDDKCARSAILELKLHYKKFGLSEYDSLDIQGRPLTAQSLLEWVQRGGFDREKATIAVFRQMGKIN